MPSDADIRRIAYERGLSRKQVRELAGWLELLPLEDRLLIAEAFSVRTGVERDDGLNIHPRGRKAGSVRRAA